MALCLAESLLRCGGFDARGQILWEGNPAIAYVIGYAENDDFENWMPTLIMLDLDHKDLVAHQYHRGIQCQLLRGILDVTLDP